MMLHQQQAEAGPSTEDQDGASTQRSGDENAPRVQLACFYCRAKRIRCSGTKPICTACTKAGAECEWPAGRRRKRTRREMEEARRAEAAAAASVPSTGMTQYGISPPTGAEAQNGVGSGISALPSVTPMAPPPLPPRLVSQTSWQDPWSTATNFVWPANFLPEGLSFDNVLQGVGDHGPASAGMQSTPGFTPQQHFGADLSALGPLAGFLNDNSPGTDMRLFTALDQTAYLSGDPTEDDEVELYYYRFSGTTALNPGINRISLKLHRRDGNGVSRAPEPEAGDDRSPGSDKSRPMRPPPAPADLFDATGLPHRHVWEPIFEKFLKHMSQHFPSVSRRRMQERTESGTMSAFLANCILALGARFGGESDADGVAACAPFVAKAQELVIPLLHLPAYDVATGLLMLAWASYGQNSDSGLWQYSGMAMRMAIDLGVHENSEMFEDQAHLVRTRLLFWTLFVTDRVVAFATGRPASIPEDIIEIPLPEDEDFFPDPARNTPQFAPEPVQPVPFVYLTRLMIICGRISNVLNGRRGRARTLVATDEPLAQQLGELQAHLVKFYASLPEAMHWSADNFKYQHGRGHGGTFLALHLWANAVLALVYHPDLLKSPSGEETPLNRSMPRNVKLALASSRQIGECMVFADLVSHSSYTATPIVVQPIYVAAMALIHEMHAAQAAANTPNRTPPPDSERREGGGAPSSNASDLFLVSMAKQNFIALLRAISRIEGYWAGAGYVAGLLEKRSGISAPARAKKTFISLPDQGLLRRFKADVRDDPRNVAPATETSLRESIARSHSAHSAGPSPVWVSDLLSGYSVENMSFAPADQLDFARLMAAAGAGGRPPDGADR